MTKDFKQKWEEVVSKKGSTIIAGCDPTLEILKGEDPLSWCLRYVEEVADSVAGIKINPKYFF